MDLGQPQPCGAGESASELTKTHLSLSRSLGGSIHLSLWCNLAVGKLAFQPACLLVASSTLLP